MSTDLGCRSAVGAPDLKSGVGRFGDWGKVWHTISKYEAPRWDQCTAARSQWLGGPHAELIVLIFSRKSFVSPQADVQVFICELRFQAGWR